MQTLGHNFRHLLSKKNEERLRAVRHRQTDRLVQTGKPFRREAGRDPNNRRDGNIFPNTGHSGKTWGWKTQ